MTGSGATPPIVGGPRTVALPGAVYTSLDRVRWNGGRVSRPVNRHPAEASAVIPFLTSALLGLPLPGSAPSGLLVLAAITLTGMLVALLAHSARVAAAVTAIPQGRRAAALREKSWRAGFLPQRDPAAAGRARPRAPTVAPAAV